MSKLMNAPWRRAADRIGRRRSRTARLVPSGSIGSNWLKSDDSLIDRLTRGRGPNGSRSIRSTAGQALTARHRPSIRDRYSAWYFSASASVTVASPSRSTVKARRWRRRRVMACRVSARSRPAMKRWARRSAVRRAVRARSRPVQPSAGSQRRPKRAQGGRCGAASVKYSRRWRVMPRSESIIGSTSMKRNSCVLTASSPMVHSMSRSSHQPGLTSGTALTPWRWAKICRP